MPVIFEKNRGTVVRVDDPTAQARVGFVGFQDVREEIDFESQQSIITRVTLSQQANVQFLHTLGASIYVYVFGDRIGSLSLAGLSFAAPCDTNQDHGMALMMDWYRRNRVSKTGAPVRITIGTNPNNTIEGFVTSSTFDTVEPESGMVQWGLSMQTLPET